MTILVAPDKFKGSLTAHEVCNAIADGIREVDASVIIDSLPLADGGEGTCALLTSFSNGTLVEVAVRDPLFRNIVSHYGISSDGAIAFMEMAGASGLQLLKKEERNPSLTSTVGTGDLIRHALDRGVSRIIMGIGGSATNDGGIGMADALGVTFHDASGAKLSPIGKNLIHIASIDTSAVHPRLKDVAFTIFCDVDNPLHGRNGAAHIFSPQKGADNAMVKTLDSGLKNYQKVLEMTSCVSVNFPGAGAGGGLPAAIRALTNVTVRRGMEFIIGFIGLEEHVRNADIVITGEGKMDDQTLAGKVVKGVADLTVKYGKPLVVVVGKNELSPGKVIALGVERLITLAGPQVSDERAMRHASSILTEKIRTGMKDLILR